jgi:sulfur-oxidizing protein SoxA
MGLMMWLCASLHAEETSPTYEGIADDERRSGLTFQSEQTRQMQTDPVANPGQLWVLQGEDMWRTPVSDRGRSCRDCHGDAAQSMRGVAARNPAVDQASANLFNLEARINHCRTAYQTQPPFNYETDELLALTSYVAYQSQGLPMNVAIDDEAYAFFERGREFYYTRQGQLNLACHHCHENNYGRRLRGDHLSQGHSNGYPSYRLEWQTLGSLHRRLRACSSGVRAIMYEYGSPEYVSLELYLAWRARSLLIETPAVRR